MKVGIENLKKCLALGIEIGNVSDKMTSTGGSIFSKLGHLSELTDEVIVATSAEFSKLSDEVSDLDDAEKAELVGFLKEKFSIADDKLENVIEGAIDILLDLESIVKNAIALGQTLKA